MIVLNFTKYSVLTLILVCCAQILPAQEQAGAPPDAPNAQWVRLKNEADEFSIEMPANFESFSENIGFIAGTGAGDEMQFGPIRILTAYQDKTLMTVESYSLQNPKRGLEILIEKAKGNNKNITRGNLRGKQIVIAGDKGYSITQYFATKTNLYVIFTGARQQNTPTMERFLASVSFDSALPTGNAKTMKFSELKNSPFAVTDETKSKADKQNQSAAPGVVKPPDVDTTPLTILTQPFPGYTPAARGQNISGTIRLRVTFSATGRVSRVGIISSLAEGLTRQALFAALRIKFLPPEKNGQPTTVTKVVEYRFSIY